jgi:broad specificity phosphatase PhoE
MQSRVNGAVDMLLATHPDDLILVAHFGVILTQVERALGVSTTEAFAQKIEPLSVTCIEHGPAGWNLRSVNHRP